MSEDNTTPPNTIHIGLEIPKYLCGTHGKHEHWVQFTQTNHPTVMYCLQCIRDFLDNHAIGKVTLP